MNFISSLLFVFYLQVMPPPPPPTMHGGGDYWAGYTVFDTNGDRRPFAGSGGLVGGFIDFLINNWGDTELTAALGGFGQLPGGWTGYVPIFDAISNNSLNRLTEDDWNALINYAAQNISDDDPRNKQAACEMATRKGSQAPLSNPNCNSAPIPIEIIYISILSFLTIYLYLNREEFSNLNFSKKSSK